MQDSILRCKPFLSTHFKIQAHRLNDTVQTSSCNCKPHTAQHSVWGGFHQLAIILTFYFRESVLWFTDIYLKKQTNKTTSVKTQFQHSFTLLHIFINRYTIFFTKVWCLKLIHTLIESWDLQVSNLVWGWGRGTGYQSKSTCCRWKQISRVFPSLPHI